MLAMYLVGAMMNNPMLRKKLGSKITEGTIANNVRIGKLSATQEEIEESCKKTSIHDYIDNLATKNMLVGVFTQGESYEKGRNDVAPDEAFKACAETSHALGEGESAVINLEEGQYLIVRHGKGSCVPFIAAYSVGQ